MSKREPGRPEKPPEQVYKRTQITLPPEVFERAKERAKHWGGSVSAYLADLVTRDKRKIPDGSAGEKGEKE